MSNGVTVEYAVKLLWNGWRIATLLYWLAAGIYYYYLHGRLTGALRIWVIASALLWGVVGVVYLYMWLHTVNHIERVGRRKSIT